MLVMLICMIVGAMFFRWLQDEDYMKNFGSIIGSFTGFFIGLAVVPTTTTKKERTNGFKWSKCRNFCSRTRESLSNTPQELLFLGKKPLMYKKKS